MTQQEPMELLVYGEVLFDAFPDGHRVLGGAPFNVAWGLQGFGHRPRLIRSVGNGPDGQTVRNRMRDWGMDLSDLQTDPDHATGLVQLSVEDGEPSYEILAPRAWDHIQLPPPTPAKFLVHGSLALRNPVSRLTLETLAEQAGAERFSAAKICGLRGATTDDPGFYPPLAG